MNNYLISLSADGYKDDIRRSAVFQNLEWINFLNKPYRVEFLSRTEDDEDGILVTIMLVNVYESTKQIPEFLENEMGLFFEEWDAEFNKNAFLYGISTINDSEVLSYYKEYVKNKFDFLALYNYDISTASIPNPADEKEMMNLLKRVYYDFHMEWLLPEDNQDYYEQNKGKYYSFKIPPQALVDELDKIKLKSELLSVSTIPYGFDGNSVVYGKYFKASLIDKKINEVRIPIIRSGNTEIVDFAFDGCTNIESASIPSSINKFGSFAFRGCCELKEVEIETGNIPDNTFLNCKKLHKISFGNNLYEIGKHSFNNCAALETISLPNTLKEIGENAFANCRSLRSITFPYSLQKIDNYAFNNCINLKTVEVPKHTKISENSFDSDVNIIRI